MSNLYWLLILDIWVNFYVITYIYKAAKKKDVGTLHYSSCNTILPLEGYNTKDTTKTKKGKNRGTDDIYF